MADPGDFESEFDDQFNAGKTVFGYTSEFLFDSDEGSPLPSMPDTYAPGPSRTMADAPQDCPSPSEALNIVSRSSRSTESSHEYLFDSVSPKGTASTASTMPTTLGDSRITFGAGTGVKQEWGLIDTMGGQMRSTNLTALHDTFGFLNDSALTQPNLRTPADTPSPFGSGAPTFSPAETMSPAGEAGPSFRAAFEDSFTAFTFDPSESGMRPNTVSAGVFAPGSLVLRQSQSQVSPVPKFDFCGSQEPDMSANFNPMQPVAGQVTAGAPFFSESLHAALQGPVEHQQYGPGPYRLDVFANNTKSRVETQIMITLRVSQLPVGVTKVHLPRHTISKPKFWTKPASGPSPDTLELHTMLVCTSAMRVPEYQTTALQRAAHAAHAAWFDRKQIGQRPVALNGSPAGKKREADDRDGGGVRSEGEGEPIKTQEGGEVQICENCIGRETKRASRKKSKNPEDEAAWQKDESKRVIVFNTHEIKDWAIQNPPDPGSRSYWQMQAPMRIACYCRHHSEKLGFQIIFTLTNHHGRCIAQTLSPSIMITDDHKTISPNPATANTSGAPAAMLSPREELSGPSLESSPSLDLQSATRRSSVGSMVNGAAPTSQAQSGPQQPHPKAISRPASPSFLAGPSKRRRGNKSITKAPNDLMMTPLDTSFLSGPGITSTAASTSQTTPATSLPPTPQPMFTSTGEMPFFGAGPESLPNGFGGSPQTNGNGNPLLMPNLSRTANMANMSTPAFNLSASARPNPASSPVAPRAAASAVGTPARIQQPRTRPAIFKVIPGEGPIAGSVEVTVMGQGFAPGMQVMFGDKQAPGAACWSSESLVCLLPPSPMACMVPVTLRNQNGQALCLAPSLFRYVDDSEQQLLRTALMILGNKMTGTYEDVADFARRIIKEAGSSYPSPGGDMAGGDGPSGGAMENLEGHLLKLLELMDLSNSTRKPRLNLRRSTGQTMLHLACKLGLHRFVAGLLARGANPDPRDKGGYTALHMASMHSHTEIVRLLIAHGADPTLRTLSGLTAADVATSRDVAHVIQHFKQHRLSQSGSALHSRVNSSVSLKSLRAQVSMTQVLEDTSSEEPRTEEEESSSGDSLEPYASDELGEPGAGEQVGEIPTAITPARRRSPSRQRRRGTDAAGALALPSAAMAAIREQVAAQFGQLQQMMGPHLQYLPQLPQFPQFSQFRQLPQFSQLPNFPLMPNMPPLPEYQNAVLQRLVTMIGGVKPEQGGEVTTPPPAYDELFPQQQQQQQQQQGGGSDTDLDTKKSSAAQAAADATADAKCAALFDQQQTVVDAPSTATETREVKTIATSSAVAAADAAEDRTEDRTEDDSEGQEIPALLQIGRKDAITREQQATLRRAHAQKMRKRSWDRNLFFVWIPLLILIVAAMVYHGMPGFVAATRKATASLVPEARHEAPLPAAPAPVAGAGVGVL